MQQRPLIQLQFGRINQPIQIPNGDLLKGNVPQTLLVSNTASGVTSLTVKNSSGFSSTLYPYLIIGEIGNQGTEIVATTAISNISTITCGATSFPHSAGTPIYAIKYNQVEISWAGTVGGSKTVLVTTALTPDLSTTIYYDADSGAYYYARFKNQAGSTFSPYSDPAPVDGYTIYSARSIIDAALGEINKKTDDVLTDQFAFQMLDSFQTDVLKEQKRWSFMQSFDTIIGQFNVGEWKIALPTNIDDPDTNKSIYNVRLGANGRLTWIDKAKWDDFIFNLAYTTLADNLDIGDLVMTLTNSGDFNHITESNTDGSGTVIIGGNSYNYSANDTATGILTLTTAITSANTAVIGQDVFQNANQGLPDYYTIFDGFLWYWPITASQYDGNNSYLDYYTKQLRIQHDSDEIVVPDADAASLYLQWKFLKKLNNGEETTGSASAMNNYIRRRETLKTKASKNRTFKMNPRFQNFAIQEQWNSGDPRFIRDGAFPNTGLG